MQPFDLFRRRRSSIHRASRLRTQHPLRRRLHVEMLEERRVLSTTIIVDDGADCPHPDFSSIQAAVTAAHAHDKIVVCPGTYQEQVIIPNTKDGLELRSKKPLQAVIQAPPGTVDPAIVHVDGADNVEITGFTITGPIDLSAPGLHTGIFVGGGGSAEIDRNHITAIRDQPVSGAQNGIAILIGRGSIPESGSAKITHNVIDDYQKGGIVVDSLGSDAQIEDNEITGLGPNGDIAQNGVQVSRGATAEVKHIEISGNAFTGSANGTGILLFQSGKTEIEDNDVSDNDIGIDVFQVSAKSKISDNEIERSVVFGIRLAASSNFELSHNTVSRSGFEGIYLTAGSNGNRVSKNEVTRNGLDGIHIEDSNDNRVEDNKAERNTRDGIRVTGTSSNNRLTSNHAKNNSEHDFHDDTSGTGTAGTANFWKNNSGKTENRPGLKKN